MSLRAMIVETFRDGGAEIEVWGGGADTASSATEYRPSEGPNAVESLLMVGHRVRTDGVRIGVDREGRAHDMGSSGCTAPASVVAAAVAVWRADAECQRRAKGGAR